MVLVKCMRNAYSEYWLKLTFSAGMMFSFINALTFLYKAWAFDDGQNKNFSFATEPLSKVISPLVGVGLQKRMH